VDQSGDRGDAPRTDPAEAGSAQHGGSGALRRAPRRDLIAATRVVAAAHEKQEIRRSGEIYCFLFMGKQNYSCSPDLLFSWGRPQASRLRRTQRVLTPDRSAVTTVATRSTATSMSSGVVVRPRPKRIDAPARDEVAPMAWRTCDGAWLPELQAD